MGKQKNHNNNIGPFSGGGSNPARTIDPEPTPRDTEMLRIRPKVLRIPPKCYGSVPKCYGTIPKCYVSIPKSCGSVQSATDTSQVFVFLEISIFELFYFYDNFGVNLGRGGGMGGEEAGHPQGRIPENKITPQGEILRNRITPQGEWPLPSPG